MSTDHSCHLTGVYAWITINFVSGLREINR